MISEQDPGIANWLETTGHRTGPIMLRWQRLERDLRRRTDPNVEVVRLRRRCPSRLPHYAATRIGRSDYEARIAARQRAVARRMLS